MAPEWIAAIGGVSAAVVTTGPAYLAMRRARGAERRAQRTAEDEGAQTREAVVSALDTALYRLEGRMDGLRDELRTDIREVREWQTSHTAQHILIAHNLQDPEGE